MVKKKKAAPQPKKKAKAPAGKKSAKKAAPKVKKKLIASKPEIVNIPVVVEAPAEVPKRAPLKKVIGLDKSVRVINEPKESAGVPSDVPAPVVVAKVPVQEELPKASWSELPKSFPASIQFLLAKAEKECELAQAWPLPFAKFIASLPREVCGAGLALCILCLDHDRDEILDLCQIDGERFEQLINSARFSLEERLSMVCPEVFRKWRAQYNLGEATSFIEPYIVPKVDRNFQIMMGSVVRGALLHDELASHEQNAGQMADAMN